ncbi:peptidase domain-containing ABC transporter [Oceanivirga salmonicida]|uniref:peptidase domain-containing ABC transporter n=1 Tax=Oceanivirga salmonicida TaxID=1769291 RepID=UPI00082E3118|nr:peptidase domain-containing ABC transporter [Oceanivirga salmonicida]
MFERYKCVLQNDERDCGPACILTIAKQYKINYPIAKLREIVGTDKQGTNIYGLIKGLNYFNFKAKAVRVEDKKIDETLPLPAIAHVINNGMFHYVVIQKISKDKIIISDPARGVVKISIQEFYNQWTGILVLVEKTDNVKSMDGKQTNFFKFLKVLKNQKSLLYNIILISIIYTILGIATSFYFKILVDYILKDKLLKTLHIVMIGVVFITFIKIIFEFIRNQLVLFLSQKLDDIILLGYYKHVLNLPLKFFSTRKIGEIVSRFSDGVNIRQVIAETAFTSVIDVLTSIFGGIILFNLNKVLFFIAIIILTIYMIIVYTFKTYIKKKNQEVLEDNALLTSNIIENLNGIETIKAYNLEMETENETEYKFFKFLKSSYERGVLYNIINLLSSVVSNIGNYIIVWIGALQVIKGNMSFGELLVFIGILIYFLEPLKKIINLQSQIQVAIVAADRIGEIIDLDLENKQTNKDSNLSDLKKDIEIKNLKFRYGTRQLVLDDISLIIKNKQKVALVGESGSGKTTLAKLLLKYYDYEGGEIKFGDSNIKDVNTYFLREKISYVSQETFLFNKSIKENLFVDDSVDIKEIVELCEKLKLMDFINSLPYRFDSYIDENGSNLSGGQKQRLSILRALLKKPDILILDEATSSLDSITESSIQNVIENLGITTIIIAHRLSTIKKCDKIFVFEKGKIIESGNHNELLELKGNYYKYWKEQVE